MFILVFSEEGNSGKEHSFIMKQFLFFYKNDFSKNKAFLKSKEGFIISVNFTCKIFPTFNEDFFLIINIIFDENSSNNLKNPTSEHDKVTDNVNNNNNENFNSYFFLLDYRFDFISITKNFYLEYDLNQNLFRELKINFCQFFCVNENKLIEKISKEKKKLLIKNPIFIHKTSLRELNKAYTIFQNIKIENTFNLRDDKLLESYFIPPIFIYDKIDKKKLVHKIPEIINIIDEIGLDYDWYIRLQKFKEKLMTNGQIQNIKETAISSLTNYNQGGIDNKRSTSFFDQNILESNLKNPEQFFQISYSIRKLGSISYYIVNLFEKITNNSDEIKEVIAQKPTGGEENFFNRRNSSAHLVLSKKLKKINSQQSIKFSPYDSKTIEEEKEEEGINRRSKTRPFLPLIISGNIINNNFKSDDFQKIGEKFIKKNSKKNIVVNEDKIFNKKEDNNNVNRNIKRNSNESYKKQKTVKILNKENSTINKIVKKGKYEEDENSELIPKDKFNGILKKLNKKNRILIIIILNIIIISLFIITIKFIICMIGFNQSRTLLSASIYLEMIKVDIYSQAILSIIYCININNITNISIIHNEARIKNQMTLEHLKLFQEKINNVINNKYCKKILQILNKKFTIYDLNLDWTILDLNISIIEEIRKLSYKAYGLTYNNETCDIKAIYDFSMLGTDIYKNMYANKVNNMQKIFFYFMYNTLRGHKRMVNELLVECAHAIVNMFMNFENILLYLLICVIILIIVFAIFYIIKACYDYSYYQLLLLYYYHIEKKQLQFENQIYYLYKAIFEFNYENISYFEKIKNNDNLKNYNEDINKIYSNRNDKNNNRFDIKRKSNKRNSITNIDVEKRNSRDQNKINGSILNGSINGSSLLLLNNSNNIKPSFNNNLENNIKSQLSFPIEKDEKEDSIDSLLKATNKILPNSIKVSLIFILLGTLIYIILCSGNIIVIRNEKILWEFSVNLCMNILERVPKLMAMLIYSFITVISNNPNKIEGSALYNNQPQYLTFLEVSSLYYSEDINNKYFKNNYFGELLRDNLRINYNVNNYLYQENNKIFKNTKKWEELLSIEGYFCIYSSIGELISLKKNETLYDFIRNIENYTFLCKEQDSKIDESGIKIEINYILQELTNKYIDFITYNISNISLQEARNRFFESKDIKRIFIDMLNPLLKYYNIIINAIYLDIKIQGDTLIFYQAIFDLCLFLANFLIIICILYIIIKGEKYKRLFAYFLEIQKSNNN